MKWVSTYSGSVNVYTHVTNVYIHVNPMLNWYTP